LWRKSKHIVRSIFCLKTPAVFLDNVEKCGAARHDANGNVMRRMRSACRKTKARIHTHFQNM